MSEQNLIIFPAEFEGQRIRVDVNEAGEPLWSASDICAILGRKNVSQALRRLDHDEIISNEVIDAIGRMQGVGYVFNIPHRLRN